jgi:DNA-directed RNA polymerase specialized sigma subunit
METLGRSVENISGEKSQSDGNSLQYLSVTQVANFRQIFSFLNGKDRDILYLIFVAKKKQKEVQEILQRSQPSLCYDIKRIRRRLRFIFYICSITDLFVDFVQEKASEFTPDEMDIMILMFYSSSFTQTADTLGMSQVRVRYTFDKLIERLEEMKCWEIYEIFTIIRENLNLIRRRYKEGRVDAMSEVFFPM